MMAWAGDMEMRQCRRKGVGSSSVVEWDNR
jgi:hypothetical protein